MSKRETWVDIVKGIAIIAVVMFHTNYHIPKLDVGGNILPLTELMGTLWHVPVFLCIGGFFMKETDLDNPLALVKKKWKSLYVKLLVFYVIFILLHNWFFTIGFYSSKALYVGKHIAPYSDFVDYIRACGFGLLAAREPLLGAMWFINLMFLGFVIIAILIFALNKFEVSGERKFTLLGFSLFALAIVNSIITQVCDIHILRATPAVNASWLLFIGYFVNNRIKLQYNNKYLFIMSLLLMYEISSVFGCISLADDVFYSLETLTVATLSSLYVLGYIAKKIQNTLIGRALSICGNESYYIMALHLMGFKFATILLNAFGMSKPLDAGYSPALSLWQWILYTSFGVIMPIFASKLIKESKYLLKKQH